MDHRAVILLCEENMHDADLTIRLNRLLLNWPPKNI